MNDANAVARVWILSCADPTVGAATTVVGAVGVDETGRWWVSWLDPFTPWGPRVGTLADVADGDRIAVVERWVDTVNGTTLDLVEHPAPRPRRSIVDTVEAVIDELLTSVERGR